MKSVFIKTRNFVALVLSALAIVSTVSCQKEKDEDTKASPLAKDWVAIRYGDTTPSSTVIYSFTQSGQIEFGVLLDESIIADMQRTFSELTLSDEGQKILESLSVGDLLVEAGGSYKVEFDESGTAGTATIVLDPEMCSGKVDEEQLVQSSRFRELQEDSVIIGGYNDDGEGNITEFDIEMKSASSLGIEIGKHHSLKALLDSVSWEEEW